MSRKNKSKKRKKKRQTKKMRKKQNKVLIRDGIKFELKGKNIDIRNIRSKEEHDKYLKNIKENRPVFFEQIKKDIETVINEINKYDKLYLLGGLSYISGINPDDEGISEVTLEYGQSIALSTLNESTIIPSMKAIEDIYSQLVNIRHFYNSYILSESVESKFSDQEYRMRREIMTESLYVRGDGYLQHIHKIFIELFKPHDEVFLKKYGFKSQDIITTFIQLEDSFCTRVIYPNGQPHDILYIRLQEWTLLNRELIEKSKDKTAFELYAEYNPDIIFKDDQFIHYKYDDINSYKSLYKIRPFDKIQQKVIENLAMAFGENGMFLEPEKYKAFILNESKVYTKPIIKHNDDYYYFAFNIPSRNFIRIGETLLKNADEDYFKSHYLGNKYSNTRDNYLEKKSIELLSRFLPTVQFYKNSEYTVNLKMNPIYCNERIDKETGELSTELDVLGISKKAIYLIEIKAGELNNSARRGSIESLTKTLSQLVGYAACQSYRALMHIQNSEKPIFKNKEVGELIIDKKDKKVFRIGITLELLAGFITNLYHLKKLEVIGQNIDYPWAISIFDLFIFSEIIESEDDFIEYINRRIVLNDFPQIYIGDEIDALGHYQKRGLEFKEEEIKGKDFIMLTGFKDSIDEYFNNVLSGIPSEKPKKIRDNTK